MLAVVLDAIGDLRNIKHRITVLDICATPLKIAEWYAQARKVKIITRQADAKHTSFPTKFFDLIVTDYFLTKLQKDEQLSIIAEWHRILRSEGRVLTTVHLGNHQSEVRADEEHARQFADKAENLASSKQKSLGIDPKEIRELATQYIKKNISYPVKNESELRELFKGFDVTVVSTYTSSVETITSRSAQVVAMKID